MITHSTGLNQLDTSSCTSHACSTLNTFSPVATPSHSNPRLSTWISYLINIADAFCWKINEPASRSGGHRQHPVAASLYFSTHSINKVLCLEKSSCRFWRALKLLFDFDAPPSREVTGWGSRRGLMGSWLGHGGCTWSGEHESWQGVELWLMLAGFSLRCVFVTKWSPVCSKQEWHTNEFQIWLTDGTYANI